MTTKQIDGQPYAPSGDIAIYKNAQHPCYEAHPVSEHVVDIANIDVIQTGKDCNKKTILSQSLWCHNI